MSQSVLIVGAGPTGLIMACELLSLGIPCRIIDRLEKPVTTSRSFTIHARTLELLDKLGLAEEFISQGQYCYSMDYHFAGKDESPKIDFRELDSLHPYVLIINQQDTEAILRKKFAALGGTIEWNTQLQSLEQNDDGTIAFELEQRLTGEIESKTVTWLIGCDGNRSGVRERLNLPFDGHDYAGEMKMMDVEVEGFPLPLEAIHYFITKDHMLLFNKLPGKNYRVLISDTGQGATTETARKDFQRVLDLHFDGSVTLSEPEWTTVFRIARRKTNNYRVGNIFLAGDAAHENSPAGGQGMNVSMQDAFNLAWKLALVINGQADVSLLDSYGTERLPIAKQMHEGTQFLHSIIMAHGSGMEERIALTKAPGWNSKAVNQIAGISYTYRAEGVEGAIADGDRAPDVKLADGSRLYNHIDKAVPTLLVILPTALDDASVESAEKVVAELSAVYPLTAYLVAGESFETEANLLVDADAKIRSAYHAPDSTSYYLLRPDRHIQVVTKSVNAIQAYFDTILVKA